MGKRRYDFQLVDASTERAMTLPGGQCWVTEHRHQTWLETFDYDNELTSNGRAPVDLVNGSARFAVDDDVLSVDVYGFAPTGHSFQVLDIAAGFAQVKIDATRLFGQTLVIPFDIDDTDKWSASNLEIDTGIDLPRNMGTRHRGHALVLEADAAETIDLGLLSTETGGDADGLISAVSVASRGVQADNAAPTLTRVPRTGAHSVSLTFSDGTDTARGYLNMPYDIIAVHV